MPVIASNRSAHLSNYASGLAQDFSQSLADFIAPQVVTGLASGQFKRYSDKNTFQALDAARAIGGKRKRVEFGADDPFYNCLPSGLETTIDEQERKQAGEANSASLEEAKIKNLLGVARNSHEQRVFNVIKAARTATGGIGVWSNAANDPISDIDSQIEAIANATGRMPNRMVFGIGAWRIFRNHARVINRLTGGQVLVSQDLASTLFLNPAMQMRIGVLGADSAKFGVGKNITNIVGAEVFVFYAEDAPNQYDASFTKTFTTAPGMVDSVREYRDESCASDVYFVDWSADIQVCALDAGRRIVLS